MKKRTIVKVLALLMCLSTCVLLTPSASADNVASGNWGALSWTLDQTGLLTIFGEGAMPDFEKLRPTEAWLQYKTQIYSVYIEDGVTSLGKSAFFGCNNMTSIRIPDSVTSLGECVFDACINLKSISLPDTISFIPYEAFWGCTSLTTLTIPSNVTTLDVYAFFGCTRLKNIVLPKGITTIGKGAFLECDALETVFFYGSLRQWNSISVAENNDALMQAALTYAVSKYSFGDLNWELDQDGLLTIYGNGGMPNFSDGSYAWRSKKADIISVVIEEGVTSLCDSAFEECESLISVSLPETLTSIGEWALSETGLTEITLPDHVVSFGKGAFGWCHDLTEIVIPEGVTSISEKAFSNCVNLSSVRIPSSVTNIGNSAFYGCSALSNIFFNGSRSQWSQITVEGNNEALSDAIIHIDHFDLAITKEPVHGNITTLVNEAPASIASENDTITMMVNPNAGYELGSLSVLHNENEVPLTQLDDTTYTFTMPAEDVSVSAAFTPIVYSISFDLDSGWWEDGTVVPQHYTVEDDEIVLPVPVRGSDFLIGWFDNSDYQGEPVTSIPSGSTGDNAYYALFAPANVIDFGEWNEKMSISNSIYPDYNWLGKGRWTLDDTGKLTISGTGHMPNFGSHYDSVENKSITNAPWGINIRSVIIEDGVNGIGRNAFCGCSGLSSIIIPPSATFIGDSAFNGCSGLSSIIIPENVRKFEGSNTFSDCSFISAGPIGSDADLEFGWTEEIPNDAFSGCSSLTSVTLPPSITMIGADAFSDCSGITEIVLPTELEYIGYSAFAWCHGLTSLIIPSGVSEIDGYAFSNCSNLTSITFPSSLTTIEEGAFTDTPIEHIFYEGTEAEWAEVIIKGYSPLRSAYLHVFHTIIIEEGIINGRISALQNDTEISRAIDGETVVVRVVPDSGYRLETLNVMQGEEPVTIAEDNCFVMPAGDVQITAAFKPIEYIINYDANGGTNAPENQTKTQNIELTLDENEPVRESVDAGRYFIFFDANGGSVTPRYLMATRTTSYDFNGWNTAADGSGAFYEVGGTYTDEADVTLYAQWTETTDTETVTLPEPTREGYNFKGWAEDAEAAEGVVGEYTPEGEVTLYAVWEANTYTVSYDANGGTNAPDNQAKTQDELLTLSDQIAVRDGYTFLGWATESEATTPQYQPGDSFGINEDTTLYAVWAMPDFVLPGALRTIEEEAFEGGAFVYVKLPDRTESIQNRAFADCQNLKYIYIPEATESIHRNAFEGVSDLTVLGQQGSYAEHYAVTHGFGFVSVP